MPTKEQIAAAFAEWERRFREDPEQFASDHERIALTTDSYGEQCATYLLELIESP